MKTYRSFNLITLFLLGQAFMLWPCLLAQTAAPAPTEQAAPTGTTKKEEPPKPVVTDKTPADPEASAPAVPSVTPTPAVTPAVPVQASTQLEKAGDADDDDDAKMANEEKKNGATDQAADHGTKGTTESGTQPDQAEKSPHGHHHQDNERVSFFHDSTLAAGEHAGAVVSILGSSTSGGEVSDAVVSILG